MSVPVPDSAPAPMELIGDIALGIAGTLTEIVLYPFAAVLAAFIAPGPPPWWAWAGLAVMAALIVALPVALACLAWRLTPRGRQRRRFRKAARAQRRQDRKGGPPYPRAGH